MSQERERPKWGSEPDEEEPTFVEESPLEGALDPLTQSLADGDAAPDAWSLARTRTGIDAPGTHEELHLPADTAAANPFEGIEGSTTERLAGPPVVIGPHAAPPIIGGGSPKTAEPRPIAHEPIAHEPIAPRPIAPQPIAPVGSLGAPRFTQPSRTHPSPEPERGAPPLAASMRAVAGEERELWVKVGIGAALAVGALLTILLVALIVASLTAA